MTEPTLYAASDLHIGYAENRALIEERLVPTDPGDWLIVAGDVGEVLADVITTLAGLRKRFAQVIWAPGNHELWSHPADPEKSRGVERYEKLVAACRDLDVLTPEDPYPVWQGAGGPVTVAPLFTLYDYTWRAPGTTTKAESLAYAHGTGIVCADESVLHPDPYPDRESWCAARIAYSRERLDAVPADARTVLVSHWPLHRHPTEVLWHPEFAQWCGTELTADWHLRYRAAVAVYGHLHIPRATEQDGVPFREVSLGYPREWGKRQNPPTLPRAVL